MLTTNDNFPSDLCRRAGKDYYVVHVPMYDMHLRVCTTYEAAYAIKKHSMLKNSNASGTFIPFKNHPPIMVIKEANLNIVAHECFHFVEWASHTFSLECEESKAYLMGFIMDAVACCVIMSYESME